MNKNIGEELPIQKYHQLNNFKVIFKQNVEAFSFSMQTNKKKNLQILIFVSLTKAMKKNQENQK